MLDEDAKGPFTLSQLKGFWKTGIVTKNTLHWQAGYDEWIPLTILISTLEAEDSLPSRPIVASPSGKDSAPSDVIGIIILICPVAAIALMIFGISKMTIREGPSSALAFVVIGTILVTAILMAVEAAQLGMGGKFKGKNTTGPVGWFFCGLGIWIIAFPAYLYSRSRFGMRNYAVTGFLAALAFTGATAYYSNLLQHVDTETSNTITEPISTGDRGSRALLSNLENEVRRSIIAELKTTSSDNNIHVRKFTLVHRAGNEYEGVLEVDIRGHELATPVDVTYDGNNLIWKLQDFDQSVNTRTNQ